MAGNCDEFAGMSLVIFVVSPKEFCWSGAKILMYQVNRCVCAVVLRNVTVNCGVWFDFAAEGSTLMAVT